MTTETEYPVEVFVAVARLKDLDADAYLLIRRATSSIDGKDGWHCSHFWTLGKSVLRYDPNLESSKAVTLCCQTDPVQIVGVEPHPFTFTQPNKTTPIKMTYRVEVSSHQIKRAAPNPIKLFTLDDPLGDLSYQWCKQVEFAGCVYGQRSGASVWLETDGAVKWK